MFFFFQAEDGIRDKLVTGVQTCALPIYRRLDARAVFRLARHPLHRLTADAADPDAGAEHGEARRETRADERVALPGGAGGFLQHSEQVEQHVTLPACAGDGLSVAPILPRSAPP